MLQDVNQDINLEITQTNKVVLGFLHRSSYFIHDNYIYRVIDIEREFIHLKGAKKITHIYVNTIMFRRQGESHWHEVKSRTIEELPLDILVTPCHIGPIVNHIEVR